MVPIETTLQVLPAADDSCRFAMFGIYLVKGDHLEQEIIIEKGTI